MGEPESLFRSVDFVKFWVGQSISVFGSQFTPFAVQVIAVSVLGATSFELGILAFLNTLPFLALGLLVGVYVDRHGRRKILIVSDLGRALVLFLVPLSSLVYVVTLNVLYVVTFLAGVLSVFFEITYQTYLQSLVDRGQIVDANSKLETSRSTAQTLGPSVAGFIIPLVTAPIAILGAVAGYLSSAASLSLIRRPEPSVASKAQHSVLRDMREGLGVVFADDRLRAIAACSATANLASAAWGAIVFKYLLENLSMTLPDIGVAFSIGGAGGILGALTAIRAARAFGVGRVIIVSILLSGVMSSIYFATPSTAFYVLSLSLFVVSVSVLWYNIPQLSYRQSLVPSEIQGRMNATMRTITWGTLPLGGILGGTLGEVVGVHETIGLMTALGASAFLWVLLSPVRHIKDFPTSYEQVV